MARMRSVRGWEDRKAIVVLLVLSCAAVPSLMDRGDRVIQTENDYNRDVFNGDLGVIESINRIEQEMVVNFEGRQVEYDFGDLDEIALAYVLSIHKSQGSEFPCIVIPLHTQHYMMLQRNLLYTAVTRGKKLVILVGTKKALGMAVRRQDTARSTRRRGGGCKRRAIRRHVLERVSWVASARSSGLGSQFGQANTASKWGS